MLCRLELKAQGFKPEFAGKMNFYLAAIDDLLRHAGDNPSIGIILCKERNKVIVEYALRDSGKPMGVAQYQFSPALPEQLKKDLPTAEDLAAVTAGHGISRRGLIHCSAIAPFVHEARPTKESLDVRLRSRAAEHRHDERAAGVPQHGGPRGQPGSHQHARRELAGVRVATEG
jgi:hypothetical protein